MSTELRPNENGPPAGEAAALAWVMYGPTASENQYLDSSRNMTLSLGVSLGCGLAYLTPKEELKRKAADFPTMDQVYGGLDSFQGDINNEFLKRLFAIVNCWRTLFEDVCDRIGQNRKYGLFNLQQARLHYPQIPAVFYTRKSLINDAVAMFKAGADGLFIKPTGLNDDDTRRLTREYAPSLLSDLRNIMRSG